VWWHISQNNAARAHFGTFANPNIPEYFRASTNQNPVGNFWVPVAMFFARAAQSHALQYRDLITYNRGFAHHEASGMVQHDATAKGGGWVDINAKFH
jgi:hypothetical protein